jgi:nicotinate phosphoribosyltransferase
MVYAALAPDDAALRMAPYDVLRDWAELYDGNLLVILPDAFGTTAFLERAPEWVAHWKGARPDSKPPIEGAEEFIDWWRSRGQNPKDKLVVLSDGMDIDTIESSVRHLRGKINVSIGWGTNLTNDFRGCVPTGDEPSLKALPLVCKVTDANGHPAVKLSDNPEKATGLNHEIERYRRVFGQKGMISKPVLV